MPPKYWKWVHLGRAISLQTVDFFAPKALTGRLQQSPIHSGHFTLHLFTRCKCDPVYFPDQLVQLWLRDHGVKNWWNRFSISSFRKRHFIRLNWTLNKKNSVSSRKPFRVLCLIRTKNTSNAWTFFDCFESSKYCGFFGWFFPMFEKESHPHHMSLTVHLITLQNSSKISVCWVTSYVSKVRIINHTHDFQFFPYVIFASSTHNNLRIRSIVSQATHHHQCPWYR